MPSLETLIPRFQAADRTTRLETLLDYSKKLPPLPERYEAEKELGHNRVHECQTPVFLWVNKRFYRGEGHLAWREEPKLDEGPLLAAEAGQVDAYSGHTEGDLREHERTGVALPPAAVEGQDPEEEPEDGDEAGGDGPSPDAPRKLSRRRRRQQP